MKSNWTKYGETRQYDGICLFGLSKTTMKFGVVSVQIRIWTPIMHFQKCSELSPYKMHEMVRGGEKETRKGREIKRKLTCNMESTYVGVTVRFSKGIISRHYQLLISYSVGGR